MTLEELQESVDRDLKIDDTELDLESIKIPLLHNKYLQHYNKFSLLLKKADIVEPGWQWLILVSLYELILIHILLKDISLLLANSLANIFEWFCISFSRGLKADLFKSKSFDW